MVFDFNLEPGKQLFRGTKKEYIKPYISIITPFYNVDRKYFEQLFNCIINQTFPWFEWIIINDGSTDKDSLELLQEIKNKDIRIKVLKKENGGAASARNMGIRESSTNIIIPLDGDDLVEATCFEILYFGLYYNKEYTWAYTDSVGFQNQEYIWIKKFDVNKLKKENFLCITSAIRKSVFEEVGYFNEDLKYQYEDWDFWIRLVLANKKPVKIDGIEFWYRRTNSGVLSFVESNLDVKCDANEVVKSFSKKVRKYHEKESVAKEFKGSYEKDIFYKPCRFRDEKKYFGDEKEKINILFVIPWMTLGGADLFNLNFVKLLDKNKYNITIITTIKSENPWKQRFREYTLDILCLPDFLDVKNWGEFISYLIGSRCIDIYMVSNSYFGYSLLPWLRTEYSHIKMFDYIHMEELYWRDGGYARLSAGCTELLEKTYVCNNKTKEYMINSLGVPKEKIKTLYIGVDKYRFDERIIKFGDIRKELNIDNDKKIVLFPCRLHNQKRPYLMVEIAKKIKEIRRDIVFIVVGDGPEYDGLLNKVYDYEIGDIVFFVGEKKDIRKYYKDANLTLICSINEGLALTAYESCSMKTPVISSNVGGQAELIDNMVGRIIPLLQNKKEIDVLSYSNEEILLYVNAIIDILFDEEYVELCNNCRKRIEEKFSLDIMIQNMEKELQLLLSYDTSEKHRKILEFKKFAEEYASMYTAYEGREQEAHILWKELCEVRNKYNVQVTELEKMNRNLNNDYICVTTSTTYKVGRVVTVIPRKIKTAILYTKKYGYKAIWKLFLDKLK